jgi:hypothetical protein
VELPVQIIVIQVGFLNLKKIILDYFLNYFQADGDAGSDYSDAGKLFIFF